ncbi:transposase [Acinetobacter baumannii]|nr:transposase [Acinetobacter baumannii]
MDKWEVYMSIHRLFKDGWAISKIAKKLGVSRNTVYKYLEMKPEEMAIWMASSKVRVKKLDPYRELILSWLKEHPDLSAAQVQDWLKEKDETLEVGESTIRSYVASLREDYQIPKVVQKRQYEAIPDPPMGQQAQVDFGTFVTQKGKTDIRLWFITFVLSHSRYKYVEWLDRPFTVKDVVEAHERAFEYFGGMPKELVYDQDILIVVNENAGDITLTKEFQEYVSLRKFTIRLCRKADPESKGRIENVVGYVKKNFAKNRAFANIEKWNEQCLNWLKRTGNGNVHNTTKKRPAEVHSLERKHLQPVSPLHKALQSTLSIARTVRKDNTVRFRSNRYSVPLGTYQNSKEVKVYLIETENEELIIRRDRPDGPIIATHKISHKKGQLIQDRQHTRDRSKGITEWIHVLSHEFQDSETALVFLQHLHTAYPRYIRDQLQLVASVIQQHSASIVSRALEMCVKRKMYSANDLRDAAKVVEQREGSSQKEQEISTSPLGSSGPVPQVQVEKRPIATYLSVLKGTKSSCL